MDAMRLYETAREYETIGDIMGHYEKSRDSMRQHETLRDIIDAMGQYETASDTMRQYETL